MGFREEESMEFPEMDCQCGRNRNMIHSWIIRLMHCFSAMNFRKFKELGIHPGQLPVIKTVSMHEGISQSELAKILHIKPPTVAVSVKRLEKADILYRKEDSADHRVSRIFLTEKGKLMEKGFFSLVEENERILTKGFSEEEKKQLQEYFGRMIQNIVDASPEKNELEKGDEL